mmetsp:Transcript_113025/g.350862  ORF Transcript_113025/g.350862 Transcript_113025/m.350862 type:complete len:108 (+) Transcript_113025:269-592(+)
MFGASRAEPLLRPPLQGLVLRIQRRSCPPHCVWFFGAAASTSQIEAVTSSNSLTAGGSDDRSAPKPPPACTGEELKGNVLAAMLLKGEGKVCKVELRRGCGSEGKGP